MCFRGRVRGRSFGSAAECRDILPGMVLLFLGHIATNEHPTPVLSGSAGEKGFNESDLTWSYNHNLVS